MRSLLFLALIFICPSIYAVEKNSSAKPQFTTEEIQWLKQHPTIRVGNENDWAPFDYVEYDKPKGFAIDYIRLVAKKAGIKIKFINGYSWAELLDLFKQQKIDVLPVIYKTKERETFTLYSKPYSRAKVGILTSSNSLLKNKTELPKFRVAMEKSYATILLVKEQYPGINIIEMNNNIDLVHSLATGKIDAILGDPLVYHYYAKEEQIHNIKTLDYLIMSKLQQLNNSFHVGTRIDWPILHSIIQKSMASISDDEFTKIEKKWSTPTVIDFVNWEIVRKLSIIISLLFVALLWHNRQLKSAVIKKTQQLQKLNLELEEKVEYRTRELVQLNEQLEVSANTDPLTNIYNRRHFFEIAKQTMILRERDNSHLSLAMIDIDNFKQINDTYGHDVGDQVIKALVFEINDIIRRSDLFARFGGEEFIILFPNTSLQSALKVCEKIRIAIEKSTIVNATTHTISIGLTEFIADDKAIIDIIIRADKLLYTAKGTGKNKVSS